MTDSINRRLHALHARYPIDEALIFGLDVGIASIGSSAIRRTQNGGSIVFIGSRCFEVAEQPKTQELKNKTRRDKRLLRRVTRRRAQRMAEVRALLKAAGLLETVEPEAFHHRREAPDPWRARAEGLERQLSNAEFAAALLHIAKHRGFRSTKKSEVGQNAPDDNKKMLNAIGINRELSASYRTVGEMIFKDPKFNKTNEETDSRVSKSRRNKGGDYSHTLAREDLRHEIDVLFSKQRKLGNKKATADLKDGYAAIAFFQRGLQDSDHLLASCPFEPDEQRCARHAPSFEAFRYLAKLNTTKIRETNGTLRHLTAEELQKAMIDFGIASKSISWNAVAKKVGLPKGAFFDGIDEKKAKSDVVTSKGCAAGTRTLHEALGPTGWNAIRQNPSLLDAIAAVIAFREDIGRIEKGLEAFNSLDAVLREALVAAVKKGAFGIFKGTGHISAKAARGILPHLMEGHVYSEACGAAGYDHTQTRRIEIDDIRNPVVQRSLREAVKQVETLIHHFGARPGRIVVELARAVGKSAEERGKITKGIEKRTAEKTRRRKELAELLKLTGEPTETDLRRYELWKEQNYRCIYTDQEINPHDILETSNLIQIDHVLPRSRSQDNSYHNQVLCYAKANQDKKQRTPWEWRVRDEQNESWWDGFGARVRALRIKARKKRNLLMLDFQERQKGFVERNLNDTKYATRALLTVLRDLYSNEDEPHPASDGYLRTRRRLFARPGQITAILRRSWGLDAMKNRADDRHHALDALICAASALPGEGLLPFLTRGYQNQEEMNRREWTPDLPPPWPEFREEARRAVESVLVCRSERRRGRGQSHKETIYSVSVEDGQKVIYERKAVAKLSKSDISKLKDAEGGNRPLATALARWIEAGKPAESPPLSPKGDPVRRVLLKRKGTAGFDLNGGHVDNASMVRVDVFARPNKKGKIEYFLVPIYRHQVMAPKNWPRPPSLAVRPNKPEAEWEPITEDDRFCFSLYPDSYIEVGKRDGQVFEGYFRGMNRSTGALKISPHNRRDEVYEGGGIGARTLTRFRKLQVDRLGGKHGIEVETRTWHGVVCT